MKKVEITSACWLFKGALNNRGYGNVRILVNGRWTVWSAHRIAYLFHKGELAEGLVVRHMCDVRTCVNPEHLAPGTQQENVNDIIMRCRGRNQYGPWTGKAFIAATTEDICPF